MKRFYESPSAEIERFTISNVFTSSFGGGIEEGGDGDGGIVVIDGQSWDENGPIF